MKKGVLLIGFLIALVPLMAQFKVIKTDYQSTPRYDNIGDVTNIKIDNPNGSELPASANFQFESIEKTSIEQNNINSAKALWFQTRKIPVAIYGMNGTGPEAELPLQEKCYQYLESIKEYLQVENVRNGFKIKEITEDDLGISHVLFQQHYRGIPFYGGELIVHIKNDEPYFLNGYWYPEIPIEETQQVNFRNKFDVKTIVKDDLEGFTSYRNLKRSEISLLSATQWDIELVYFKPDEQSETVLSWKVIVHPNLGEEWHYFIANKSGDILNKFQSICNLHGKDDLKNHKIANPSGADKAWAEDLGGHTRELNVYNHGNTYYLMDVSRDMYQFGNSQMPDKPVGVIWTLDAGNTSPETDDFFVEHISSGNNSWNNPTAVSAHFNAQTAYDYYKNTFGRNSINAQGGNIISLINVTNEDGTNMDNAFWSGKAMFYGNGNEAFKPLAGALDVAGHEMTHGVIQSTANLEYYGEPGAINESYADIFGCMIDRDDWQLGEDVVLTSFFPSGALRDMSDPHNGGFSLSDLGYQPKHVNEQFLGEEDNAGVHVNSGIPNHAFYLFATAVGKDKAERIYYRALNSYLTKSSKFIDLRVAIEQAAYDMYGAVEKQAASVAFESVGISGGSSGGNDYQNDLAVNPGNDLILFKDGNWGDLVLATGDGTIIQEPLSTTVTISKPSISDDGSEIVFVGEDQMIHYIYIDWSTGEYEENIIQNEAIWRNVIISKDGWRIAAITETLENKIHIFDFGLNNWQAFEIYNPTTVQGVTAGDVDFVDVMEFNYSGEWIMYDAQNTIQSEFGSDIVYWDVGFINVFNNNTASFADGLVQKLFAGLPENTSIGNPTFSKNSPYIVAFDYQVGVNENFIVGSNLETGEVSQIYESISLGYPNYSRKDDQLLFDFESFFGTDLGILNVDDTKINYVPNSDKILKISASWGVWFSNGFRDLILDNENIPLKQKNDLVLSPNPVSDRMLIEGSNMEGDYKCRVFNFLGECVFEGDIFHGNLGAQLDLSGTSLPNGQYILHLQNEDQFFSKKFIIARQ